MWLSVPHSCIGYIGGPDIDLHSGSKMCVARQSLLSKSKESNTRAGMHTLQDGVANKESPGRAWVP